ncbi:MAG: alpha/beta hydrolase [Bdellovibrionota bacterium]
MRILVLIVSVIISVILSACALINKNSNLKFNVDYPLYSSDGEKFNFNEVAKALDKTFAVGLPVLLFIHGRGDEPQKSLTGSFFVEGQAVKKLEEQYKIKVLMFNWNSKAASLYDRSAPLSQMSQAADSLKKVLIELESYFLNNINKNKKIALLVHSMGSIVLQTYLKKNSWPPKSKGPLFSQIILTSPDVANTNHADWLSKISEVENVYISINKNDDILEKSTDSRQDSEKALGLRPEQPYSPKTTYLDLTGLGDTLGKSTGAHEVFNKEKMKNQLHLCQIFNQLLTSKKPDFESTTTQTNQSNYLKIKFNVSKTQECFNF